MELRKAEAKAAKGEELARAVLRDKQWLLDNGSNLPELAREVLGEK